MAAKSDTNLNYLGSTCCLSAAAINLQSAICKAAALHGKYHMCLGFNNPESVIKILNKKKTFKIALEGLTKLAATYFPTWYSSIIGTNGLNFSVRYGKRWIPIVITTIYFLLSWYIQHIYHRILY